MTIRRYVSTASLVCSLTFGITGAAFADTADVSISNTGADSVQKVELNTSSSVTSVNDNTVGVVNFNDQSAQSGNVNADKNTSIGGDVTSGNASNSNVAGTTVAVSNDSTAVLPVGGSGGSVGGSGGVNSGNGGVLGAATVGGFGSGLGAAVLPRVGATFPVDVSALRAAWHPQTNAPTAALAKGSRMFTAAMLITATLLSLLGALGTAFYARRRQERV